MTTKQYLNQIRYMQRNIAIRMQQLAELDSLIAGLKSPILCEDKVQTSFSDGGLENKVIQFNEYRDELQKDIMKYLNKKQHILKQIEAMPDERYKEVLIHKYIEFKKLEEISEIMGYEFYWTCKLHGKALRSFEKIYLQEHQQTQL